VTLSFRVAARTDVGRARERNEDSLFAGKHVFAVADGLGGHQAGNVASSLALQPVAALDEVESKRAAGQIADAVRKANRAVVEQADTDTGLRGMGTTLTAIALEGATAHLAHVGDSRCYLLRGSEITQMSRDHTLVARMVSEGKLTPEQAETHPQRSMLTRALGAERSIDVDEMEFPLEPGDRLLLCSDGLTGMLADHEIRALAATSSDLDEICAHLVDEANARGGLDNITVVLIDVGGTLEGVRQKRRIVPQRRRDERRVPVRALVWVGVVLAVVLGGYFGLRAWAGQSYFVGFDGDHVAIFKGWPVDVPGLGLQSLDSRTNISKDIVEPYYVARLEDGVTAKSLADAQAIVARIPLRIKSSGRLNPPASPTARSTP
jgi:protein phosphatase